MTTTATQSRLHLERMERERRLSARAVPDCPVILARPPPGVNGYTAAILKQQERQRRIDEHKQRNQDETLEQRLANLRDRMIVKYEINSRAPSAKTVEMSVITITDVQNVFCNVARTTRADLSTDRRHNSVVHNRQLCMMLCKALTLKSLPEIGRRFGGKDHTTVLHAVRRMKPVEDEVRRRLPIDATLLQWVNESLVVFHALPKGALKGRGLKSHG